MTDPRATHDRWEGEAAAYALHALDEDEARAFEAHLAGCERCQNELAKLSEAVRGLAAAVPTRDPAPELKQRVMADVAADARVRTDTHRPAAPAWRARTGPRRPAGGSSWRRPQIAVALGAVVAALVVVGLLTLGSGTSARTYAGVVHAPGASASIVRSGDRTRLRFSRMPAPPPGRIYQVWLQRRRGTPEPTRTLFASSTGSVAVSGSLRGIRAVLVTAEPRPNGSPAPTRAPIIVVPLA